MSLEPIPGIDALKLKKQVQEQLQKELAGLSDEEQAHVLQEGVESGSFAALWRRLGRAEQERERTPAKEVTRLPTKRRRKQEAGR